MKTKNKKRLQILFPFLIFFILLLGIGIYKIYRLQSIKETHVTHPETLPGTRAKPTQKELPASGIISGLEAEETPDLLEDPLEEIVSEPEQGRSEETPKELHPVYIALVKSLFAPKNVSFETFQSRVTSDDAYTSGKVYFQDENGRLESYLWMDNKGAIHEQLTGQDGQGNRIDEIEIGLWSPASKEKTATLSVNKLSIFEWVSASDTGKKEERVTEYTITPQLRFQKGKTFVKVSR
ncbi:MAG: hypothetical protein EZS26_001879 [Candidatus Ordinivivax streblomastigis]|uniref:Uncharacterized protein n=1 Tax=Candidatus Ordinivivax streblomastigis TaxID=2540710 RepID=A0A5M8P0J6_9BACT|nr:MAG: hypothetical protein EZS26_001879 [Candidatus Ordinivivax streblomastigis]